MESTDSAAAAAVLTGTRLLLNSIALATSCGSKEKMENSKCYLESEL